MSVGVGDVIALVGLVERVATELRLYRDASAHFQQASAELHFFQAVLNRLLKMETDDGEDDEWLGLIRASAIRCQQPIVKFLEKMKPKENLLGLGNRGTTLSLTAVKHRLHWSMIARKDLEDLRQVVTTSIIMLVGMQQMSDIRKALHQRPMPVDPQMQDFFSRSAKFGKESANLLTLPKDLENLKVTVSRESSEQKALSATMSKRLEEVSLTSNDLIRQNNHLLKATDTISETLAKTASTLITIAHDIKHIISVLGAFSREVLARIAANGQLLLGIHAMLKRLLRAVEAIPLHLSLPLVRLDDATGESWALPYQACQTLASFKNILQVVVFGNNRVGARYVRLDKVLLRSAKDGIVLNETNWSALVTQGFHVSQAVILDRKRPSRTSCPFPSCGGLVRIESGQCVTCGKHSSYERVGNDQLDLLGINSGSSPDLVEKETERTNVVPLDPMRMGDLNLEDETLFRNVHYQEMREPITSIDEASRILSEDPEDPSALRYTACFRLSQSHNASPPDFRTTLNMIEKAIALDSNNADGWYLLGRAWMERPEGQGKPEGSYNAYKQAAYRNGRCPIIWMSLGILYFRVHQYRDSLDAFSRSIRLNPANAIVWRNVGVSYESCNNQSADAMDAYERALEYQQDDPWDDAWDDDVEERLMELRSSQQRGVEPPECALLMKDHDLSFGLYSADRELVESFY